MSKTYKAARKFAIESLTFQEGDVVGTGDIAAGVFTSNPGQAHIVQLGHIIPRVQDGRIVEEAAVAKKATAKTESKK